MSTDALQGVAAVAARQHGLVHYRQLIEAGYPDRRIEYLAEGGWLRRRRWQVYAIPGCPESWERELHAVVLSAGAGAVASGSSAARLWGWRYLPEGGLEITVPRERRARLHRVTVRRVTTLDPEDIGLRGGIPVTSFARTLVDCSGRLSELQLSRVLDEGLRADATSLRRLAACVDRLTAGKGRSLTVVRRLLDQRGFDYDPGGSAAERRVLHVIAAAGLPLPVQQHPVRVDGQRYVLDFAYVERKGFIEFYGLRVHSGPSAVAYDSARISDLTARGWRPLIFTDATGDREMARQVAELLGLDVPPPAA